MKNLEAFAQEFNFWGSAPTFVQDFETFVTSELIKFRQNYESL